MVTGRNDMTMVAGGTIGMTKEISAAITLIVTMTGVTYTGISERLRAIAGSCVAIYATETIWQQDENERN